jgi:hypothetical protein
MAERKIARATQPHLPTLAATLTPLLAVANAGGFNLRYEARLSGSEVVIEQVSFSGVTLTSVDSAVASAADHTSGTDDKHWIKNMTKRERAVLLYINDRLNALGTAPTTTIPTVTPSAAITAIEAKYDAL